MTERYPKADGCAQFCEVRINGKCGTVLAKCVLGVVKMFEAFGLDPEEFELVARKTSHPTSIGIPRFQEEINKAQNLEEDDENKVQTPMDKPPFKPWFKLEKTNFVVSFHYRHIRSFSRPICGILFIYK